MLLTRADPEVQARWLHLLEEMPMGTREVWLSENRRILRLASFAGFTMLGQTDYATVFFVDDDVEPILGLTVLESLGLLIDPARERLLPPSMVSN